MKTNDAKNKRKVEKQESKIFWVKKIKNKIFFLNTISVINTQVLL
jgi:hypothetical protein